MSNPLPPPTRRRLLAWFDRNARPLPWRHDRDPYRIWVSEVMLQQTTVAAVTPRFAAFLTEFPDVQALAAADEQAVLKAWEGMGYYSRARNLKQAAEALVRGHGGDLPDDPAVWAALPGVGRYILGAVLSQAFDRRLPVIEANTKRVLCRVFGQPRRPTTGPVQAWLWETAAAILPRARAGDFNQALMELGATVCTPDRPACDRCPLRDVCVARREGLQDVIPVRPKRPDVVEVREVCVVARHGDTVLLVRRPAGGRWANMWEFPRTELAAGETVADGANRLLTDLGINGKLGAELMTVRYGVTRFRMTMACLEADCPKAAFRAGYYRRRALGPAGQAGCLPGQFAAAEAGRCVNAADPAGAVLIGCPM